MVQGQRLELQARNGGGFGQGGSSGKRENGTNLENVLEAVFIGRQGRLDVSQEGRKASKMTTKVLASATLGRWL